MQNITIALHIGAAQTDNDQLIWSLRKDATDLLEHGVLVRRPGTYKKPVNQLLEQQAKDYISDEEREALLAGIVKDHVVTRIVLSNPDVLGVPSWMLASGRLFRNAGRNTQEFRDLFPDNDCEFFLGIRNPATLVPAVFAAQSARPLDDFMSGADMYNLRWSDVIQDIVTMNPDCPITVWCNEETPLLWPKILGKVTRLGKSFPYSGQLDIIREILSDLGVKRLETYLSERPHFTEAQKTKVMSVFLERFCSDDDVEEEIDLPGWSQDLVDTMTDLYLDDIETIRHIPGVTLLE